jgi:phosphonate transport system substrate-binding protein
MQNGHNGPPRQRLPRLLLLAGALVGVTIGGCTSAQPEAEPGSAARPLRVMLIPAYGGTESGTKASFGPLFHEMKKSHGLHFDLAVGSSYAAVVESMANDQVDIAWFGTVSYMQARQRGAAELLAVAVDHGDAVYHSAIFARNDSGIEELGDLRGKKVAFGDPSSTSSFNYPVAMMIEGGVHPVRDLGAVVITDSHAASLGALAKGDVDAACSNMLNLDRAVEEGVFEEGQIEPVIVSPGIPNPPLAMNPKLPEDIKLKLKDAFHHLHENPEIRPEMIRGEGDKVYERYDAEFPESRFVEAMERLAAVTDDVKQAMLEKAQEN